MTKRVATHTLRKLRSLYLATWHIEWPYEDTYLSMLWLESRAAYPDTNAVPAFPHCLELMRESHDLQPSAPSEESIPCQS